jgi:uncharacterized protein (TIGR02271 family)
VTLTQNELATITDGNVVNEAGDKLGAIGQIYVDDQTGQPSWVTVKTGLFGTSESFVPLTEAAITGTDIQVRYDKDTIKNAPRVDPDGHLSPEEEQSLYSYYGLSGNDSAAGYTEDRSGYSVGDREEGSDTVGYDTSGPTTDDAMTRSEEQVRVGTQTQETGRARLRKYVVTENVTQTVPVSREEVRIEREPITDANRDAAMAGPAISDEEHEVVLREERPVVEKETVPVERVRLETDTITDEVTVNEEVRKEQIDTDVDGRTNR